MVGLIWTIQTVHYPLFALVPGDSFPAYESSHTRRMGWLLAMPAGAEVVTGAVLVWSRPPGVGVGPPLVGGAILAGLWLLTALVQVPMHRSLSGSRSDHLIGQLVRSNWMRTAGWSLRGLIVLVMLAEAVEGVT